MKRSRILILGLLTVCLLLGRAFAEPLIQAVQPALFNPKGMLVQSGVAFDASETILGIVHVQEPRSFFKPDVAQVTWWGEFKPFKFWGKPELEAVWYAPPEPGVEIAKQSFRGQICVLAKSTLKLSQPATEGTWRVDVYSKGQIIDSKKFVVYASGGQAQVATAPSLSVQLSQGG